MCHIPAADSLAKKSPAPASHTITSSPIFPPKESHDIEAKRQMVSSKTYVAELDDSMDEFLSQVDWLDKDDPKDPLANMKHPSSTKKVSGDRNDNKNNNVSDILGTMFKGNFNDCKIMVKFSTPYHKE